MRPHPAPVEETSRLVRLAILESYGVRWTRETFARDLLQNFFDAAPDFRSVTLDVRAEERTVEVRGPVSFDIDLLAYVGATTKRDGRTVGGFGEGFKVCALVGVRDFGLSMGAGAGEHELRVLLDPVPLGRELCYRVGPRRGALDAGAYVRLEGCDDATLAAFRAAPAMFRHPDNPKLGEPIVEDAAQGVAVYPSLDPHGGEIYYRRQLRGRARFYGSGGAGAVTLAHDGIIDELEGDRDRRDLQTRPIARAIGDKLEPEALHRVLLYLMPYWKFGNDVLSGLLEAAIARKLGFAWPPRWLARVAKGAGLVEFAERQGFNIALASFAEVGMPTPTSHYRNLESRAPTPLERARIDVVAGLYAELAGKPAKTTAFEVFDRAGAAVMGQHLGDKVIVQAELLEEGFDAVAGTVLHELGHETGGEEDLRFLNRLTALIGAAIREPERVRAARRRYAAARPAEEEPAAEPIGEKPLELYAPERPDGILADYDGVVCSLIAPPGFPPVEPLIAELRAAAEETGIHVWLAPRWTTGPIGAVSLRAPGVPTLWVGDIDPEPPPPDRAALGYRLRTFGPDGARAAPDREALKRALVQAKDRGWAGMKGLRASFTLDHGARERVRALLGVELPERAPADERAQRDADLVARIHQISSSGGLALGDKGKVGVHVAGALLVQGWAEDPRGADELVVEMTRRIDDAMTYAGELVRADADFDDGDAIERDAMEGARGAAVAAAAPEADPGIGRARARAFFDAVRAATTRALDLDVELPAKIGILNHALAAAGLEPFVVGPRRPLDLAAFARELDRAVETASRMQRQIDEEGGMFFDHKLHETLDDEGPRKMATRNEANRVLSERQARESQESRAIYLRTLAETGSAEEAGRRCLDAIAARAPELGS